MNNQFPDYAGRSDVDAALSVELQTAGIKIEVLPESLHSSGEVRTIVAGSLGPWFFRRCWYYWTAEGPGIPVRDAEVLHSVFGKEVRVAGHCGCPSPREWFDGFGVGSYHIDTQEGLNALAATIRGVMEANESILEEYRRYER